MDSLELAAARRKVGAVARAAVAEAGEVERERSGDPTLPSALDSTARRTVTNVKKAPIHAANQKCRTLSRTVLRESTRAPSENAAHTTRWQRETSSVLIGRVALPSQSRTALRAFGARCSRTGARYACQQTARVPRHALVRGQTELDGREDEQQAEEKRMSGQRGHCGAWNQAEATVGDGR